MELSKPSEISALLSRHGFSFSKGLGQNFIINPSVCPKMAEECGATEKDGVLEIGTGIGVLTKELALRAKKVAAVELDTRLFPILKETLDGFTNVNVIHGDVMKVDLKKIIAEEFEGCEKVYVCANLPYYITSPVIMKLLEEDLPIAAVTVMVQKEAADRLCAEVGSRESGAVTVAVKYYSEPRLLFKVNRSSFMPSPNVDSAVIRLNVVKRDEMDKKTKKVFFAAVKSGFAQRRKTLTNALSAGGFNKSDVLNALNEINLPEAVRGEALTMENWQELSFILAKNRE